MKVLALIPARGGSKRLPRKNIKNLDGKPLINWTIESAQKIDEICSILVSTDDPEIAHVAELAGAAAPWLRPKELARDNTTSIDVALHALSWFEGEHGNVDGLLLLQPTSPFRTSKTIFEAIRLFEQNRDIPVVSVSPSRDNPFWSLQITDNLMRPLYSENIQLRSQDLPDTYHPNGSIYLASPEFLKRSNSFFDKEIVPLIINSPKESIDIDTHWDFSIAEHFCNEALNGSE
jgi:CMP-N,N'-diacetyllegionaminic acid synthase